MDGLLVSKTLAPLTNWLMVLAEAANYINRLRNDLKRESVRPAANLLACGDQHSLRANGNGDRVLIKSFRWR